MKLWLHLCNYSSKCDSKIKFITYSNNTEIQIIIISTTNFKQSMYVCILKQITNLELLTSYNY